jgi:ribosome assembly protein YihI (activator of Der GTPase)
MHVVVELDLPSNLEQFQLPTGVNDRLQELLDRQDRGETLTDSEQREAEGLVDLAEFLSLLKLRTQRVRHEHLSTE